MENKKLDAYKRLCVRLGQETIADLTEEQLEDAHIQAKIILSTAVDEAVELYGEIVTFAILLEMASLTIKNVNDIAKCIIKMNDEGTLFES